LFWTETTTAFGLVPGSSSVFKKIRMQNTSFSAIKVIAAITWLISCSKDEAPKCCDSPTPPSDTSTTIQPAVDPPIANTIGFFLDDWKPKTFTPPAYTQADIPVSTSATIVVDASNIITKIPTTIFGNNANPYMTQMVSEPTLINHLKNLQPKIVRFPGGNISSVFFWDAEKNTPPSAAPAQLVNASGTAVDPGYWYGKNSEGWTLSTDNYYNMLRQTGSEGIITINYGYARYGTGSDPVADAAHLAAEWVRYDNGRTKYWEIGNESNGEWQAGYRINVANNKDGQPEIITGELYGKHFKVFADSMKKAASEIGKNIFIGAQLLAEAPASWATATDKSWNAGVLSQSQNVPDYYIVHSYYTPYNTNSTPSEILASAPTVTHNMIEYLKQQVPTGVATMKPVALTEWNIFAVGSMQMVSHINGMHAVMVLGELLKNKYGLASRWDLANGWDNGNDQGMFNNGDEPGGGERWNPRPVFYYMYYFQKMVGDRSVQASVTGNNNLEAYASTFSSGEAGVVIVNKSTTSINTTLSFKNFKAGSRFYWYTLTGGNENIFSRKVMVNGTGPSGISGGPANYIDLKAMSAETTNGIKVTVPAQGVVYVVAEKV
jgi:hypothetical protein